MYYRHFSLSGPPFQFTPSADVLYPSKSHKEALAALEWGLLHEPSGLTLLIGEPGTGKTTLISSVLSRHLEHVRTAYIANPRLSFDEILQVIGRQLGIAFTSPQRLARLDAIDEFLAKHSKHDRVTVIVDEAQVMPDRVLEELRLLSNYTPDRQNALRFVFVGQTEFLRRLESSNLRQLNERIGARAMLSRLQPGEIQEYIDFRLRARGGSARDIFAPSALRHIAEHSGGIPRRINVLCHNAMLLAYTSDSKRVRGQHAKAAAAEYEDLFMTASIASQADTEAKKAPQRRWWSAAAVAAVGGAAFAAAWIWSSNAFLANSHQARTRASAPSVQPRAEEPALPVVASNPMPAAPASAPSPAALAALASATGVKPAAQTSAPTRHRVREIRVQIGDTVANIAERYLGSREKLAAVVAVNPQLADVDRIYPGDVIYLPATGSSDGTEQ